MERVFGVKKYSIEKNNKRIDIYGGDSLYNRYDIAEEDAIKLDADEIIELVFKNEYSDIPIDVETVWMNPNRDNVTVEDDEKEIEGNKNYTITYYLNTACRERRPETRDDIENDWKVIQKKFNTDLEAYEYVLRDCLQLEDEDIEDIYDNEDAQDDIEKIEAIQSYFDNQDVGDGSIILVSIQGPEQAYDFGFEKPEIEDLEENLDTISENKQKFIDFCADKITDLGDVMIEDSRQKEDIPHHVIMHSDGVRQFENVRIIADLENPNFENLMCIDENNNIVINTPMIDYNEYAASLQFDLIDEKFYDYLMNYWDDLYMDERMNDELNEN